MPNITVNTTSTSFRLLPADLSQYANWLSQYSPPSLTIYQDQYNVLSGLLSISNSVSAYLGSYGYSSVSLVSPNEVQVTAGPYTLDYSGSIGSSYSDLTEIFVHDSATGLSAAEFGNLIFPGYPWLTGPEPGSTLTQALYITPNPVTPSSNLSAFALLSVSFSGSVWSGTTTGYVEAISDTTNNKLFLTTITENPTPISFYTSISLSTPNVVGVDIDVSDPSTGTTSDSVHITGFSYAANSVPASQAVPAAIAGNDVVSISGTGSLNVLGALVNAASTVTMMTLSDTAANVVANLDYLQTLAAQGKLGSITLTDSGTPVLTITTAQQTADAQALAAITSPHSVTVTTPIAPGLLGGLSANQQLEMVYVAYFNRAADGVGGTFWVGQNVQAQALGQGAGAVLTNIANSFTPQPETIALYPFLGSTNVNLNSPAGQAGLTTFVTSLYGNLFGHGPDSAGQTYWVGQVTSGAVGLGAAALAIANGATGADAIEVQNKIAVAVDFTTRTTAVGLGEATPLPATFLTAARGALNGVDGTALNDASVTAGMSVTSVYISGTIRPTINGTVAS